MLSGLSAARRAIYITTAASIIVAASAAFAPAGAQQSGSPPMEPSLNQTPMLPPQGAQNLPDVPTAALNANLLANPDAATAGSADNASTQAAPVIQWLLANNATVTPLGNAGGLAGWLISKNGAQQTIYVTPDGKHIVAGIMASDTGEDITALQLTALTLGHAPVITKTDPSGRGQPAKSPTPNTAPFDPAAAANNDYSSETNATQASVVSSGPTALPQPSNMNPAAAVVGNMAMAQPDMHELTMSPADLSKALNQTAIFTLGAVGKPDLVMLADPNCPYCHASWNLLGPLVQSGKIDVTVMLVSVLRGSDDKAIDLLANPAIGTAWLSGEGSEDGVQITKPGPKANISGARFLLTKNNEFKTAIKLEGTPTLLWVSRANSHSPYRVYRGTGLAGVGGFLTDVENTQVATIK
jgi:protein-disulfide isomerase